MIWDIENRVEIHAGDPWPWTPRDREFWVALCETARANPKLIAAGYALTIDLDNAGSRGYSRTDVLRAVLRLRRTDYVDVVPCPDIDADDIRCVRCRPLISIERITKIDWHIEQIDVSPAIAGLDDVLAQLQEAS